MKKIQFYRQLKGHSFKQDRFSIVLFLFIYIKEVWKCKTWWQVAETLGDLRDRLIAEDRLDGGPIGFFVSHDKTSEL